MSELKVERTFANDVETVFAFLTEPDNLLKWWGHEGMTLTDHQLDFTKPGQWKTTLVTAEGGKHKMSGEVLHVDPPHAVEFTWAWHDENDARGHNSRVRFEVRSNDDGGTEFALIHTGLPDEDSATSHTKGWTSSLKQLERLAG